MGQKGVKGGQFKLLSDEQVQKVHQATVSVLEDVGIRFMHRKGLEIFADNGCRVNFKNEIVRIPEGVLMPTLAKAPKRVVLYGKTPEWDVEFDITGKVFTMAGAGALWVLDMEGNRRPSTLRDLEELTRLQDALENLHIMHFLVTPQDVPEEAKEALIFATLLKHTRRPQHTLPGTPETLEAIMDLAAVLAGSRKKVSERPTFAVNVCVTSCLMQPKERVEEILACCKHRLPMLVEADAIAGGTSPFTILGCLVEMNANILAAIAFAQMVEPGVPCIYSSSSGILDMAQANYSASAPESTLLHQASTQMAHFYGLPHQGGNTPDSKLPDAQMGYERASHFLALAYAGCDIIHVATGNLEQMRLASYEQCVMDNEILGACFRIVRGVSFDDDHLGVDALRDVGPGGSFLEHPQTLKYLRSDRWYPHLTDRRNWEAWERDGAKDMRERAKEEVQRILREHHPQYVTPEQVAETDRIVKAAQNAAKK